MPHTVKFLIAGTPPPAAAEKGDVVEVVPSTSDWGNATVTPTWIRLNVTGITSAEDTQIGAEDKARAWLEAWHGAFTFMEVAGATPPMQRYRVEAEPNLLNDLTVARRNQLRNAIVAFLGGTLANQGQGFIEVDGSPGTPLDELENIVNMLNYRRFNFPSTLIDQALNGTTPGEPKEVTITFTQANNLVEDKLKT